MGEYKHLRCPRYKFWFQLLNAKGFSKQNFIKRCLLNSLSVKSLDSLMRISIDGLPTNESDLQRPFKKWSSAKARMILN